MPKKELDLFQLAAIHMTELCACSAKVVRGKMIQLYPLGATPNHVPDDVFGDSFSPRCIVTATLLLPSTTASSMRSRPEAIHSSIWLLPLA